MLKTAVETALVSLGQGLLGAQVMLGAQVQAIQTVTQSYHKHSPLLCTLPTLHGEKGNRLRPGYSFIKP